MALQLNQPFPMFFDLDGSPLDNGYIYIGTVNANPETSPVTVYWDAGLTLPATQPLRTINGHISRSGTPSVVFHGLDSTSVTTKNARGQQVLYSPSVAASSLTSVADAAASAAAAAASAIDSANSAADAAASAAYVLTQAQLEDYLNKMRFPIGGVIAFADDTIPYGYLECNGAAISRTAYAELFASIGTIYGAGDGVTTFNLPDLRGEWIRGWDHGRLVDSARVLGSAQVEMIKGHEHSLQLVGTTLGGVGNISVDRRDTNGNGTATMQSSNKALASANTETRPRNVAMMYCIKAYDAPLQSTPPSSVVTDAATARTLTLSDQSKYIRFTNGAAVTVTVPPATSEAFPVGTEIHAIQAGAGTVSFLADVGVTINAVGLSISAQWRAATLKKVAENTWDLFGALT